MLCALRVGELALLTVGQVQTDAGHTARTTAATELLDEGVPIEVVQTLLGHASPVTTQRYDRGIRRLSGHGAYRLAALLTDRMSSPDR